MRQVGATSSLPYRWPVLLSSRSRRRAVLAVTCAGLAATVAGCSSEEGDGLSFGDASATTSAPATSPSTGSPSPSTDGSTATPTAPATPTGPATPTSSPGVGIGEVVEGFPTDLVPVLPGSQVSLSNVARDGGRVTLALAGTTTQATVDEVIAFYTEALEAKGFAATRTQAPPGTAVVAFSRGQDARELLTLTVTDSSAARSYTIGGQVG